MIPLSHWLSHRCAAASPGPAGESIIGTFDVELDPEPKPGEADAQLSLLTDRIRELEEALMLANEQSGEMRVLHARLAEELEQQLGERVTVRLAEDLRSSLGLLQETIETSVAECLVPFLAHSAAEAAASKLIEFVSSALRDTTTPLLSVRAPGSLHGSLAEKLEGVGATVLLEEGAAVELVFGSHTARFESLAANWLRSIEGTP